MKKGLFIFSNNMEDAEALFTRDLLVRSGIKIDTVSLLEKREVKTAFGVILQTDKLLKDVVFDDYDLVIIPGGKYVSEVINTEYSTRIINIVNEFKTSDKHICAICAAPSFLGVSGILDGKNFTCYPSFEKYVPKGKYFAKEKVVIDGKIITSRGPGTIIEFSLAIIKEILNENTMNKVAKDILFY